MKNFIGINLHLIAHTKKKLRVWLKQKINFAYKFR